MTYLASSLSKSETLSGSIISILQAENCSQTLFCAFQMTSQAYLKVVAKRMSKLSSSGDLSAFVAGFDSILELFGTPSFRNE